MSRAPRPRRPAPPSPPPPQDPAQQRHLLRLWLSHPGDRPQPPVYEELYGGPLAPGQRGGIRVDGEMLRVGDLHVSLEAV